MVHKGSVAQRIVLLEAFPQHRALIDQYFGYGGDNDIAIMIDPTLDHYTQQQVQRRINGIVQKFLEESSKKLSVTTTATRANEVKHITIGSIYMDVAPSERQSFKITTINGIVEKEPILSMSKSLVFVTSNSLNFKDGLGRNSHFDLLRLRVAFMTTPDHNTVDTDRLYAGYGRRCASELLDVSICGYEDDKTIQHYEHYASGGWTSHYSLAPKHNTVPESRP